MFAAYVSLLDEKSLEIFDDAVWDASLLDSWPTRLPKQIRTADDVQAIRAIQHCLYTSVIAYRDALEIALQNYGNQETGELPNQAVADIIENYEERLGIIDDEILDHLENQNVELENYVSSLEEFVGAGLANLETLISGI